MYIVPKRNDRAIFIGPTGSGKTTLAHVLLNFYGDVLIVDPKHQWEARKEDLLAHNLHELETALDKAADEHRHVVYIVPEEHLLRRNASELDKVADMALQRGDTTLYYDELYFVASGNDFAERAPRYFAAVTTGRSKGVGVWASVQRPRWIPLIALTETDVRATFFLRNAGDRQSVENTMGNDIPWEVLRRNKHSFVMADDMETTIPLKLTFK